MMTQAELLGIIATEACEQIAMDQRAAQRLTRALLEDDLEFSPDELRGMFGRTPDEQLPVPDNPEHVNNLNKLSLLELAGFEGPDASLEESLEEYGMAWRDLGSEVLFVYFIREDGGEKHYDRDIITKDTDFQREYNWADFNAVADAYGITVDEWMQYPLTEKVYNLVQYYGWENVFGSSYWEGFTIDMNQ